MEGCLLYENVKTWLIFRDIVKWTAISLDARIYTSFSVIKRCVQRYILTEVKLPCYAINILR